MPRLMRRLSSSISRTMTSTSSPSETILFGGDVLVGPVHFGDVHQAFDAGFELDERAVVGDVRDLAEQAGRLRVAARNAHPRVVAHLLQTQRDTVLLGVELEDLGGDFPAGLNDFARVADAAPCHVGDVQQAVDAAEVHERTVFGDVLDHAADEQRLPSGFPSAWRVLRPCWLRPRHGATARRCCACGRA